MRGKEFNKRLCALGMSVCVFGSQFLSGTQMIYAESQVKTSTANSEEDQVSYKVLKQDDKGRTILSQAGDIYTTTEYIDDQNKIIEYKSEGIFDGKNYYEKVETIEHEKNQFGSVRTETTTDSEGSTLIEYDENDNVTREVNKDGTVSLTTYKNGYVSTKTCPYTGTDEDKLYTKYYEYSNTGNMLLEKVPVQVDKDGSVLYHIEKYEYDSNSNVICKKVLANANEEDSKYTKTQYEYDSNNNLIKVEDYDISGKIQSIAQYYYDENNNKVRQYSGLTDPLTINGLDDVVAGKDEDYSVIKYEYDSNGNLIKETDSNNNSLAYSYDSYGNVCKKTDKNGNRFEYTYRDGIYLAEEKVFYPLNNGKTPDVVKKYEQEVLEDGNYGMLYKISEGDSSVTKTYTVDGEVESETDQNGNKVAYKYDKEGKILENIIYAKDGSLIDGTKYVYNEKNQLESIKDVKDQLVCSYEYDDKNQLVCENYANGVSSQYDYDLLGNVKTALTCNAENKTLYSHEYEYTLDGNLINDYDVLACEGKQYLYDSSGHLYKEVAYSDDKFNEDVTYAFDESGNRISVNSDTTAIKTTYNSSNHITMVNNESVKYDNNGNLVQKGNEKYYYDYANRLIKYISGADTVEYVYDVYGNMIQRISNGKKENLVWANNNIVATIGDKVTYYHRGVNDEVKAASGEETVYFHDNRRDDIVMTSYEDGNKVNECQYDSFGNVNIKKDDQLMLGFTGEFYDPSSNLVYLSARFYNPETGNFMTEDTIDGFDDEIQTLNRYMYCTNNPLNYTDPTGHWGGAKHREFTQKATNDYLVLESAGVWADKYLHSIDGDSMRDVKLVSNVELDSKSKSRLNKLSGKCFQEVRSNGKKDIYKYRSILHGRGDYDKYLPYIMSISLQLKAGYLTDQLVLKYGGTNEVYEQINFDLLIKLPSVMSKETKNKYGATRKNFSLITLGIAMHLAEDLWAHTATIRVMEPSDSFESDKKEKYYNIVEAARKTECGISYLHLSPIDIDASKYGEGDKGFGESKYLNMRIKHSINAAKKLYELYSGKVTTKNCRSLFTGTGGYIMKKTITVKAGGKSVTFSTGRYKLNGGKEQDICTVLYNPTKYSTLAYIPDKRSEGVIINK